MNIDARAQGTAWNWQVRLLHWLTLLLLFPQVVIAMTLMGRGTGTLEWLAVHVSLGALLLAILVARVGVRLLVHSVRKSSRLAAALQVLLYIDLLAVSATGWLSYRPAAFSPRNVLFGMAPLPRIRWLPDLPWLATHRFLVWLLIILIAVHVAAVAYHSLVRRDGTFSAMLTNRLRRSVTEQGRASTPLESSGRHADQPNWPSQPDPGA